MWLDLGIGVVGCVLGAGVTWWYQRRAWAARGVLVPQSEVHVRLADGALWQGSSDLVQTLALERGSQWTLTGDATVLIQLRDSAQKGDQEALKLVQFGEVLSSAYGKLAQQQAVAPQA